MAIIRLDCNLNGGDSVTPNNELFYRIYGDVDNYAAPIWTTGTAIVDANVTVNNDTVIITGVDGATNTRFKIAAVDAAFNESVLSDVFSSGFKLVMNNSLLFIQATESAELNTDGNFIEMSVLMIDSDSTQCLFGYTSGFKVQYNDTGSLSVFNDAGAGLGVTVEGYAPEGSHVLQKIKILRSGSNFEFYLDDALLETLPVVGTYSNMNYVGRASSAIWKAELHNFTIKNGATTEYFGCNEGTGNTVTGDNGTVTTIGGYVDDSVWATL